jgi:antitoxin (DNA-binding transcriptional repressor) of toxin-antitoxin stability system
MVSSGTQVNKSFQSFMVNDGLLARMVEAIKKGDEGARRTGEIQTFEAFYHGFRQNIVIGRIMVVPAKVADSPDTFPVSLLYGCLVKELYPEDLQSMIAHKVGESEFDIYNAKEFAEIKDKLFKNPKTGRYDSLVVFVPSWSNHREYVVFKMTKDDELLMNLVRHLVFSAYYDPRLSNSFDQLMTEVDPMKLDVTDVPTKYPYPFLYEGTEKQYPELKKFASYNVKKAFFTLHTAEELTTEALGKGELDVMDALSDALGSALGERKDLSDVAKQATLPGERPHTSDWIDRVKQHSAKCDCQCHQSRSYDLVPCGRCLNRMKLEKAEEANKAPLVAAVDDMGAETGLRQKPDYNEADSQVAKMNDANSHAASVKKADGWNLAAPNGDTNPNSKSREGLNQTLAKAKIDRQKEGLEVKLSKSAELVADLIASAEDFDAPEIMSTKAKKSRDKKGKDFADKYKDQRKFADVALDFEDWWDEVTEDIGPAPEVEVELPKQEMITPDSVKESEAEVPKPEAHKEHEAPQEVPVKQEVKHEAPQESKFAPAKKDAPKPEAKKEAPKQDFKKDAPKQDASKPEAKKEAPKQEVKKEAPKQEIKEAPKQKEAPKPEAKKEFPPKKDEKKEAAVSRHDDVPIVDLKPSEENDQPVSNLKGIPRADCLPYDKSKGDSKTATDREVVALAVQALKDLRSIRDDVQKNNTYGIRDTGDRTFYLRGKLNEICDRLDVLVSKLYSSKAAAKIASSIISTVDTWKNIVAESQRNDDVPEVKAGVPSEDKKQPVSDLNGDSHPQNHGVPAQVDSKVASKVWRDSSGQWRWQVGKDNGYADDKTEADEAAHAAEVRLVSQKNDNAYKQLKQKNLVASEDYDNCPECDGEGCRSCNHTGVKKVKSEPEEKIAKTAAWMMKCPHCGRTARKDDPKSSYHCECGWASKSASSTDPKPDPKKAPKKPKGKKAEGFDNFYKDEFLPKYYEELAKELLSQWDGVTDLQSIAKDSAQAGNLDADYLYNAIVKLQQTGYKKAAISQDQYEKSAMFTDEGLRTTFNIPWEIRLNDPKLAPYLRMEEGFFRVADPTALRAAVNAISGQPAEQQMQEPKGVHEPGEGESDFERARRGSDKKGSGKWFDPYISYLTSEQGFVLDSENTSKDGFVTSYESNSANPKAIKDYFKQQGFVNRDMRAFMGHTGNPHINMDGEQGTVQISWHPKGGPVGVSFLNKASLDTKEAGFNFFFPGQALKEFYPELQHEIVDYPNANNAPMMENIDINEQDLTPHAGITAYVSTSPAAGMGIGRDGKPQVLEGVPLRSESDIRGPGYLEEMYQNYPGIAGKYLNNSGDDGETN